MTGLDTSVLIPLAIKAHPRHTAAVELTRSEIQEGGAKLALLPSVLSEFVHAVSDPRRFEHPMSVDDAVRWLTEFLSKPECVLLNSDERAITLWLDWMREHRLGRKRVLDTQLAAALHTAGVRRLLTSNPDDFRVFGVFELLVP